MLLYIKLLSSLRHLEVDSDNLIELYDEEDTETNNCILDDIKNLEILEIFSMDNSHMTTVLKVLSSCKSNWMLSTVVDDSFTFSKVSDH